MIVFESQLIKALEKHKKKLEEGKIVITSTELYFKSIEGIKFCVIGPHVTKRNPEHYYDIEFPNGKTQIAHFDDIVEGRVKYEKFTNKNKGLYSGVGSLGPDIERLKLYVDDKDLYRVLLNRWGLMLSRCYCKTDPSYKWYGAEGVTVCDRWLTFTNYMKDVVKLENYDRDSVVVDHSITLDKDILQDGKENKVYSPETCMWADVYGQLSHRKSFIRKDSKDNTVIDPTKILYNRLLKL